MLLWFLMKASACNFTKSNTSPCVFFTFFLNWTNSIKSRKALHIKEKLNVWRTQNLTEKDMIYICFYSKKTLGQEMHFWNNYFLGKSSIPRDTFPLSSMVMNTFLYWNTKTWWRVRKKSQRLKVQGFWVRLWISKLHFPRTLLREIYRKCSKYLRCVAWFGSICTIQKREKHPKKNVTFSKVAGVKITLLHGSFSHFLNCTNGTKSRIGSHLIHW